ncbi:two-component system histidine kinase PnpS [Clostridium paridis]|uniref:histidine kinase n=1 Tax=Clostridium paridis TaxID=2803863 RepID=A0A937FDG2_9CLOT|nr:ATP-binding protein [Clostridium paridis]MBL4930790.1 HAMP domain-containing protein [Clostridium paridis]
MRKKILFSIIVTVLFALIVVSTAFITMVNYQYVNNAKETLKIYNDLVKYSDLKNIENIPKLAAADKNTPEIRITYILKDGKVVFDSDEDSSKLDNHNTREEVQAARQNGEGSAIRFSNTLHKTMVYYATQLDDGSIIRTSIPLENTKLFYNGYFKYYILVFLIVILVTIWLSFKLIKVIVEPVKEMEFITSRIAQGEYNRRVRIFSKDELGSLGKTFNNMAEQLQSKINEVVEKQNRLEAILTSMDSGVIAVDRMHNIIMINPYAKNIFSIKDDIIGKPLLDHIRDFELDLLFEEKSEGVHEIKIIWPSERILRIRTTDIINGSEFIGTVAVLQDITDIRRLENMRSEFVANVSHELKTPLTSIKGFAETLKYVEDEATRQKFLGIIDDESERLTRLINDILTLSNIEQNNDIIKEEFHPKEIVEDVTLLMKKLADDKKIQLNTSNDSSVYLYGSKDGFKQMVINLLENAIKYSEEGDTVNCRSYSKNGEYYFEVEDTGCGIPENELTRIFERFYRVDKARSRAKGGTGLGLAIVKHIIKSYNGTIDVQSEVGKGSKFLVKIKHL